MKKIKTLWLFVFATLLVSCGGGNTANEVHYESKSSNRLSETFDNETHNTRRNASYSNKEDEDYAGKYTFVDGCGEQYTIYLEADKTAKLIGGGNTFYASWSVFDRSRGLIDMDWSDHVYLTPSKKVKKNGSLFDGDDYIIPDIDINDGYFYFDYVSAKSKDPNKRFKLNKKK